MKNFETLGKTLALGALAVGMSTVSAFAKDVTIRYSNWLPSGYYLHDKVFLPFMEEVEQVTEGRVTFEIAPKFIGSVVGSYDVVVDGLADAAVIVPSYTTGRFVPAEGVELPWLGDDFMGRSVASWRAYENFMKPAGVFGDVKVLAYIGTPTAHIFTKDRAIGSVEDLSGVKLRSPGQMGGQFIEMVGASPVSKPISEVYELMSGGVIDGIVTNASAIAGFKLDEVANEYYHVTGGIVQTVTMVAMNLDTWNSISPEDQAAIDAIAGEAISRTAGTQNRIAEETAMAKLAESGIEPIYLSDDMLARMKDMTAPITADWIARAKEAGLDDPQAMLDAYAKDYAETSSGS
ncbi:TRAP transporter substrate-binding protein [Mesobacterium pallidum]|uniref:TRAP transporter substrate-binding protein n=1 Tax=Mesobacterium pallidum TaxID=2872037 RepID=UPI001EE32E5C|nr:TRAP transporter substrate-binding protein [Mesobacterium pallidum]